MAPTPETIPMTALSRIQRARRPRLGSKKIPKGRFAQSRERERTRRMASPSSQITSDGLENLCLAGEETNLLPELRARKPRHYKFFPAPAPPYSQRGISGMPDNC